MKTPKTTTAKSSTLTAKKSEPKSAGTSAVQSLGPRRVGNSVIFVTSFPNAKIVYIAGDFNNWNPEKTQMTKANDGTWQATIEISKGIYKYRLIVDGNWQQDPHNNATEPNQYGGLNSVLKVD